MLATTERQTPANYIRYALENPRGITPHLYKEQLKTLLRDPCDNAGDAFRAFKQAAQLNASLSSTFYSAVCDVFKKLREGVGQPQRWTGKMETLKDMVEDDATLLRYTRETLLGGAIPDLITSHSTDMNLQVASDILTVAGTSPKLVDVIKPEWVRPIVVWQLKNAHHQFQIVAPTFAALRGSPPFASVITDIENKYGTHVDSMQLPHDKNKNLVLKFNQAHGGSVDVWVVDLSKPGRANHPHEIDFDDAAIKYKDSMAAMLERSTTFDRQTWVEPIATKAYCHLG